MVFIIAGGIIVAAILLDVVPEFHDSGKVE